MIERQSALLMRFGPRQELFKRSRIETVEDQNLGARQKRSIQLERGILGGRADQRDRPVLDIGQEAVLLGAIEAVDLVDEEQRALAPARGGCGPARRPSSRSATPLKMADICSKCKPGFARQQTRDRGLSGAGRPPQDDRRQTLGGQQPGQRAFRPDNMILAYDLGELAGPQTIGKRARRILFEAGGLEEIGHQPPSCICSTRPERLTANSQ